ncbi:MAG: DUF2459 domain-containing protein [Hyphomonadaceae bacterium]
MSTLGLSLVFALWAIFPSTARGECIEIAVHSNGFHTSVSLPAASLPEDHPLRALFPDALWVEVGWGDEAFFREAGGGTVEQGVAAAFAGGPTVVQAYPYRGEPAAVFSAEATRYAAITREGAAALAAYLDAELVRGGDGAPIVVAPGHNGEALFLRGREGRFHLFNNCNHWTARALRAAGLPVRDSMTADAVMAQLRGAPERCE